MKKIFNIVLFLSLIACEDSYEDIYRYSRPYYLAKSYPILLDASEILVDIEVKSPVGYQEAFKITSHDKYLFVGEKMKGIHVYEKMSDQSASPLCFIECKHLKAFDIVENHLYCNNFVDLLIIDVQNPLQAKVVLREKEYFNKYYYSGFNMTKTNNSDIDVYEIGTKSIIKEGVETDMNPAPDFSEEDRLYSNMIVKEIPDDIQNDRPYVGFANVEGEMFTFGQNAWAVMCSYASGFFKTYQASMDNGISGPIIDLRYSEGVLFAIGSSGFFYLNYHQLFTKTPNYQYWYYPLDVVPLQEPTNSLVFLNEFYLTGLIFDPNNTSYWGTSLDAMGATSLMNVNDTILALGKQLIVYYTKFGNIDQYFGLAIEPAKYYPNISGMCMLREDNTLIVAGRQGLSFYDISDLNTIKER